MMLRQADQVKPALKTAWPGVGEDQAEAAKWFRLAAEQGHAGAQFILGDAFPCGRA